MKKTYYEKELKIGQLLKVGSSGTDVKKAQEWLNLWRYISPEWTHTISTDGAYGNQTKLVVQEFQTLHSLNVDGIVGDDTFNALCAPMQNAYADLDIDISDCLIVLHDFGNNDCSLSLTYSA